MNFHLTEPNPGDRIRANLIREIVRAIRSLTPVSGHGVRITRGPNGTVYNAVASAARGTGKSTDLGCYRLESVERKENSDDKYEITFGNCYYRCGGRTCEGPTSIPDAVLPGTVSLVVSVNNTVPSAIIESDGGESSTPDNDYDYYILPLYKLDADGNVECDFRNAPSAAMFEFGSTASDEEDES